MGTFTKSITAIAVSSLLLLAGCGGDDDDTGIADLDDVGDTGQQDDGGQDGQDGQDGDSDVVVTVDGVEYPMTIVQTCETERDESRSSDLKMYGFAESGERIELSFSYQNADDSPSGTEQFYGQVGVASGQVSAQVTSDEPFDFLEGDRSTVSGSVTMETTGSSVAAVAVEFTITCP